MGQLSSMVEDYILNSRKNYGARAVPLSAHQRAFMQPFFPAEILDQARLVLLRGERIQDPPFYGAARMMGFKNLPSFADTAAVTFVDVIVSQEEFTDDLLFHELVHAVQYAQLGTREFASRYVNGFISGGSYENIPLEKQARELEQRRRVNKGQAAFSVSEEVEQAIARGSV
jgi:hypothetical protein